MIPESREAGLSWTVVGVSEEWAPADRVVEMAGVRVLFSRVRPEGLAGRARDWVPGEGFEVI
jgi:hypothetical protein